MDRQLRTLQRVETTLNIAAEALDLFIQHQLTMVAHQPAFDAGTAELGMRRYAAAVSILRALDVPVPGGGIGVATKHTGGIVWQGDGNAAKVVSPMWFKGAVRYHTGGIAGLKPNEVPAILERQEEVLTTSDPRHRNNLAGGGDELAHALA